MSQARTFGQWIDLLAEDAELPLADWDRRRDSRPRSGMPSVRAIESYWAERCPPLGALERDADGSRVCWACDFPRELERAHILPWQLGGSDSPANFSLLCHRCHRMSEDLYGRRYFQWLLGGYTTWFRVLARWELSRSPAQVRQSLRQCVEDVTHDMDTTGSLDRRPTEDDVRALLEWEAARPLPWEKPGL